MNSFEMFTERQKRLLGEPQDPLEYSDFNDKIRVQIHHILRSVTGEESIQTHTPFFKYWNAVHSILCRELGLFYLGDPTDYGNFANCMTFLHSEDVDNILNFIDLAFHLLEDYFGEIEDYLLEMYSIDQSPIEAINELNKRFKENNLGYQFVNGQLVRVDSYLIHENVVKPSLTLLHNNGFSGAEEEFLKGYEHLGHRRHKEAIAEALKAFESTIKTICDRKGWSYDPAKDTSNTLIDIVFREGLIPAYLKSHFTSLKSTLTSGVPTLRNKTSGHGQGENTIELPEHFTAYALHLAATNILFLVECYLEME